MSSTHTFQALATDTIAPDERRLWSLTKDGRCAEARIRRMGGFVELQVRTDGVMRFSVSLSADELQVLLGEAAQMREEFAMEGWLPGQVHEGRSGTSSDVAGSQRPS